MKIATRSIDAEEEIETLCQSIQRDLWRDARSAEGAELRDPLAILEPGVALERLGFELISVASLGTMEHGGTDYQVAGEVDFQSKKVYVSNFSRDVQLFTAAHELGHVALRHYAGNGTLHRDRPLSGPTQRRARQEREADSFAACFLMPRKPLMSEFRDRFYTDNFVLNDESAFHLCCAGLQEVRMRNRSTRDLSMTLARAGTFAGYPFVPLHQRFRVSPTAMAIRIEQLGLVASN